MFVFFSFPLHQTVTTFKGTVEDIFNPYPLKPQHHVWYLTCCRSFWNVAAYTGRSKLNDIKVPTISCISCCVHLKLFRLNQNVLFSTGIYSPDSCYPDGPGCKAIFFSKNKFCYLEMETSISSPG